VSLPNNVRPSLRDYLVILSRLRLTPALAVFVLHHHQISLGTLRRGQRDGRYVSSPSCFIAACTEGRASTRAAYAVKFVNSVTSMFSRRVQKAIT
jgi:hypothetical protein